MLYAEQPLVRDNRLKLFLEEFQIITVKNYPTDYTYVHGSGKSIIDYILQTDVRIVNNIEVQTECCENTLPHCPVVGKLVQIPEKTIKSDSSTVNKRKVNWKEVDRNEYKCIVSRRIRSSISDQDSDIDIKIEKISDILLQTSTECAPLNLRIKEYGVCN